MDVTDVTLQPIGTVRGGRAEPVDDDWDAEVCTIELDPGRVDADALVGLAAFSHVEVVYLFHLVDEADVVAGARRPRGRTDWPEVGILAQRGRVRPNRLGVTVARVLEVGERSVTVQGLDAVDGSPVLDLKPFLRGFAPRGEVVEPAWATELMAGYWDAGAAADGSVAGPSGGVAQVAVVVPDYDDALDFYVGVLGFHLVEDTPLGGGKRWVVVRPPTPHGASVLLARADGADQVASVGYQTGGRVGFFLHVVDCEAEHRRLAAAGVRFEEPPRHEAYGTVAVFVDVVGNRWDLIGPPSGS